MEVCWIFSLFSPHVSFADGHWVVSTDWFCPGPSPSVGKFQIFYGGEASPHAGSGWAVWVKMSLSKGVSPSSTWKEPLRKSSAIATWMLCHPGCCSRKNASEKSQDNSGYPKKKTEAHWCVRRTPCRRLPLECSESRSCAPKSEQSNHGVYCLYLGTATLQNILWATWNV